MAVSCFVMVEPAPVDILVLGLLLLGIVSGILTLKGLPPLPSTLMAVLILANIVSFYNPIDLERAFWYIFVTAYLVLSWFFFVAFLQRYETRGMEVLVRAYTFSAVVCVTLGTLSYFHFIGFQDRLLLVGRLKGLFKDPNVCGPYLIPVALFALAGVIRKKPGLSTAIFHLAVLAIASLGVLLSYSRACWINYSISVVAYFAFSYLLRPVGTKPPFSMTRALLFAVLAVVSILGILKLPAVQAMMAERVTSTGLQGYDRDRFHTQRMAFQSALVRPLGIGPGQAEQQFDYATHSSYMRVLSENGFVGFVAYTGFVLLSLGRSLVMTQRTKSVFWRRIYLIAAACIIGHMVNSGVVDTVHWRHYWFLLALPWYTPLESRMRGHNHVGIA
ncbi:MAG TPA: O-antigen ligase family protein [Bryobacteraceae bacterium]|nr:O-antigen ligase family protein [Bryobacteraceae bacterium]